MLLCYFGTSCTRKDPFSDVFFFVVVVAVVVVLLGEQHPGPPWLSHEITVLPIASVEGELVGCVRVRLRAGEAGAGAGLSDLALFF